MLVKQSFHYVTKEPIEPVTNAATNRKEKFFEENKSNTKAVEELDKSNVYVKVLELMNKNGVKDSVLIRFLVKLLILTNKCQFGWYNDFDSD